MKFKKTKEVLNQLVADFSQMSMVIHQTHWYMRGTEFLTMHPLMDTFMDDINDQLDEASERLITLGGAPYSTLKEMAENAKMKDEIGSYDCSMNERFAILIENYRYLVEVFEKGIEVTGEEEDNVTQDMFIGFKSATEKRIWMIQAQLGKAPELDK